MVMNFKEAQTTLLVNTLAFIARSLVSLYVPFYTQTNYNFNALNNDNYDDDNVGQQTDLSQSIGMLLMSFCAKTIQK